MDYYRTRQARSSTGARLKAPRGPLEDRLKRLEEAGVVERRPVASILALAPAHAASK
jgi:DNA-binding HxlR family transcriptional regulator